MRGILFALSFVLFVVGCCFGIDGAVAGTGAHTAVFGWGWFAAALIALGLAPDRGISRDSQIEAAFFQAATPRKEVWVDVDLSDLDSFDETLDLSVLVSQVEVINGWIAEILQETEEAEALEVAVMNTLDFLPPLGTTPRRSRTLLVGREYFLPPSLGLKA